MEVSELYVDHQEGMITKTRRFYEDRSPVHELM